MALASDKRFVEEGAYVFIEAAAQDSLGYCRHPLKEVMKMWLARTDLRVTKKGIEDGGFPRAYVASPSDTS
jgi:hypothetical protein